MRARLVGLAMLVLVTPPSVVLASNHTPCPSTPVRRNLPLRVVDGDTFRLHGERVRIVGIDTPERGQPESARATYRLLTLLRSGPIAIVRHGRDVYCRTLADVYVNGWNVAAGLSRRALEDERLLRDRVEVDLLLDDPGRAGQSERRLARLHRHRRHRAHAGALDAVEARDRARRHVDPASVGLGQRHPIGVAE